MPDDTKPTLDYAAGPGPTARSVGYSKTNGQSRMICAAILLAGGTTANDVTGGHGDVSGAIIAAFGFIVFLIEFIRSYGG